MVLQVLVHQVQEEVREPGQAGGPHELQRGAQLQAGGEEEEWKQQHDAQPRQLRVQPLLPIPRLRLALQRHHVRPLALLMLLPEHTHILFNISMFVLL